MRGRNLPASRTDRFARPVGTAWIEHADHVQLDTPDNRWTWSGHSLVLDEAPDDLSRWRARWHELNDGKGVGRAMVAWEGRRPVDVDLPSGADHYLLWALMCDRPIDRIRGPAQLESLLPGAVDELLAFGKADADEHAPDRFAVEGWLARAANDQGHVWGARIDGELVGVCCLFHDDREARTQWIATHPGHRRQGICTQLLTNAVATHQEERPGIVYTVADADSVAERLYQSLGWRRATSLQEVIFPPVAPP